MKQFLLASSFLAATLLSGCSGGGGGGESTPQSGATINMSGTITAVQGVLADGDVNDPFAPFATNDTSAAAQIISNPVTVTGFASMVGSGPAGSRFASVPDEFDGYKVNLAAGQIITLVVSQWNDQAPTATDLDLFLYDLNENLVASSEGVGPDEFLIVPADGAYYVVIEAFAGASNYQMAIGASVLSASAARDRLSRFDEFRGGEVIVSLKAEVKGQRLAANMSAIKSSAQIVAGREDNEAPFLIQLNTVKALAAGEVSPPVDRWSGKPMTPEMASRAETVRAVKAHRSAPETRGASPNYVLHAQAIPNDPYYPYQWHYPMIKLPQAWDITIGARVGNPVIVAVIDTGVKLTHPDLANQLVPGYDFISSSVMSLDGDGIDANPDDPGDKGHGASSSWHGTHVAGTIAAQTNNGVGVAGVAPLAKVMPVRVLGSGGTTFDMLQGIRFAAGLSNTSGTIPSQKADIINLSLGGGAYDQSTQDAIAAARAAGVIVIAAAGNENVGTPVYPASYSGVVSVSAVGMNGTKAPYSNYGSTVDLAAPGGDMGVDLNLDGMPDGILSTVVTEPGGVKQYGYDSLQGTSMAAPHVAGVAALMRAVAPTMTPAQFDTLLANGALTDDLGDHGKDTLYGYGLVNALKAVKAAQNLSSVSSTSAALAPSLSRLDFGDTSSQQTLRLTNAGTGGLTVASVTDTASWLTVTPVAIDGNSLGDYVISVNRNSLAPGAYSANIGVVTNIGTTTIPVTLGVSTNPQSANAGRIYVLLIDANTGAAVKQLSANAINGMYNYTFTEVTAGKYRLIAGADLDNDSFVCGAGEACGGWPIVSEPGTIDLVVSRSNINFSVGTDAVLVQSTNGINMAPARGFPRLVEHEQKDLR